MKMWMPRLGSDQGILDSKSAIPVSPCAGRLKSKKWLKERPSSTLAACTKHMAAEALY
jgi:hypothetical protein